MYIYGTHAAKAALLNNHRIIKAVYCTENFVTKHTDFLSRLSDNRKTLIQKVSTAELTKRISINKNHQGIVLKANPLRSQPLLFTGPTVILDHLTDPQNIGALWRLMYAMNVTGCIVTKNHFPAENETIVKVASGTFDLLPYTLVTNISRTIELYKEKGFWVCGLDSHPQYTQPLDTYSFSQKTLFIFGEEGKGMRPLTKKHCDILLRIPIKTNPLVDSLNVTQAAAMALYAYTIHRENP